MNTTECFRANCRQIPEASYARLFAALAKSEGHVGKLPKGPPNGGKAPGHLTVKHRIIMALGDGPMTRADVCRATDRSKGHISAELSNLARMGIIRKDTIMDGGIALPAWRLL